MHVKYDPAVDMLYVHLADLPVHETQKCQPGVYADLNYYSGELSQLVGVEIFNFSEHIAWGIVPPAEEMNAAVVSIMKSTNRAIGNGDWIQLEVKWAKWGTLSVHFDAAFAIPLN